VIEHRVGNLLEQSDLTHIAHQCNLYHTFGSGIAKEIKSKFPRAFQADCSTPYADKNKLGGWSISVGNPTIFNLYTQIGLGSTDRRTSYDAFDYAFQQVEIFLRESHNELSLQPKLGIPYKIGCGLANGNWNVVSAIIDSIFKESPVKLVICQLHSQN
jgi:hypothetical protein